jgi:hypothetical protein
LLRDLRAPMRGGRHTAHSPNPGEPGWFLPWTGVNLEAQNDPMRSFLFRAIISPTAAQ